MTPHEKAEILVQAIRAELACGTKHFSASGKPLETELEILDALVEDGKILMEATEQNRNLADFKKVYNRIMMNRRLM